MLKGLFQAERKKRLLIDNKKIYENITVTSKCIYIVNIVDLSCNKLVFFKRKIVKITITRKIN